MNLAVAAVCLALVAGYRAGTEQPYNIVFERSVLGLYVGGQVQYLGVPVGRVDNIYVGDDGRAYVNILIDPSKVTLHDGVSAKLEYYSFATGTMCVALSGGDPGAPRLPIGTTIPAGESLVESFSNQFAGALESMNDIIEQIRTGLDGMEKGELTATIRETKDFIEETRGFVEEARGTLTTLTDDVHGTVDGVKSGIEKFNKLADSAAATAESANETIKTLQAKLEPLDLAATEEAWRSRFETMADRFDETSKSFDETARTVMYGTDNLQHGLMDTMQTLNETLEAVRDLAQYLQNDPSSIIRGKATPQGER
jgi:phospholipid/cholesterol/gamma-HCH transport system substrate-binding protein